VSLCRCSADEAKTFELDGSLLVVEFVRELEDSSDTLAPVDEYVSSRVRLAYKLEILLEDSTLVENLPKDTLIKYFVEGHCAAPEL
jgi:hypothetical protein